MGKIPARKASAPADESADRKPDPIDVHVGQKLRQRRMLAGMSQEVLGVSVGLTFQQIQKYERGVNRIGASRLYRLGRILGIPVEYFYTDLPVLTPGAASGFAEAGQTPLQEDSGPGDMLHRRETLDLVRAFYKTDPKQRRKILELIKAMASAEALSQVESPDTDA